MGMGTNVLNRDMVYFNNMQQLIHTYLSKKLFWFFNKCYISYIIFLAIYTYVSVLCNQSKTLALNSESCDIAKTRGLNNCDLLIGDSFC